MKARAAHKHRVPTTNTHPEIAEKTRVSSELATTLPTERAGGFGLSVGVQLNSANSEPTAPFKARPWRHLLYSRRQHFGRSPLLPSSQHARQHRSQSTPPTYAAAHLPQSSTDRKHTTPAPPGIYPHQSTTEKTKGNRSSKGTFPPPS